MLIVMVECGHGSRSIRNYSSNFPVLSHPFPDTVTVVIEQWRFSVFITWKREGGDSLQGKKRKGDDDDSEEEEEVSIAM